MSEIQVTFLKISLSNLTLLYCFSNQLTSLKLQGSTSLEYLYCNDNQLTSINLQGLTSLENINCNYNDLSSLNLQGLINLQYLTCHNNQLTTSSYQSMETVASNLDASVSGGTWEFSNNTDSVSGTNLETILISKEITVIV